MVTLKAIKRQQNLNNKRTNDRLSIINENTSPENSQQTTSRRESQNPTLNLPVDRNSKSPERINSFNDLNFDQQINSADDENFEQIEQINSFNDQNFDQIEQINSSDNEIDIRRNSTQLNSDRNQNKSNDNAIIIANDNLSNEEIDSDGNISIILNSSNDYSNENVYETRDNLEMQKNCYLCFINADGTVSSEIGKQFLVSGYLKSSPLTNYKTGQVIKMGTSKKKVLALVTQSDSRDTPTEKD
ncbi:putative uncharacterized protein DDB_G0284695 [Microplitis demolitor]|uniref:putative uncharacterized protein DDB_G0284695 n=1 Tax=Microplitis demolitor TaxID=69319 RepID=UPI0006D4E2E7|nr:putative uncharacterized protein DDB_G0284695 [Microplitis demolitor]